MNRLVDITPIARGLLANPTGDADTPYEPVILRSLASKEAIDFAGSAKNASEKIKGKDYPAKKKTAKK